MRSVFADKYKTFAIEMNESTFIFFFFGILSEKDPIITVFRIVLPNKKGQYDTCTQIYFLLKYLN